jgi:hypothetical protein
VDSGGNLLPSAGRYPVVQQWHGSREASSEKFGPREIVDLGNNWPQPAGGRLTVQLWHGTGDTIARDTNRAMWYRKPKMDGRSGRDVGMVRNATMA